MYTAKNIGTAAIIIGVMIIALFMMFFFASLVVFTGIPDFSEPFIYNSIFSPLILILSGVWIFLGIKIRSKYRRNQTKSFVQYISKAQWAYLITLIALYIYQVRFAMIVLTLTLVPFAFIFIASRRLATSDKRDVSK